MQVFEGSEATVPLLGFWLDPGGMNRRVWRTLDSRALRERIEARDGDGKVVFCKIYTWDDRATDSSWIVEITVGQTLCGSAGGLIPTKEPSG